MRHEREDLALLLALALLVPLVWALVLGWGPALSVAREDAQLYLPLFARFLARGGAWTEHLVEGSVLGGVLFAPVSGAPPLARMAAALGLSPTSGLNLVYLGLQVLFATLGARLALDAAVLLGGRRAEDPRREVALACLVGLALAFAPLFAWRMLAGHANLLAGTVAFVAVLAVVAARLVERLTRVLVVLAFLGIWHGVAGLGAQVVVYGAVFGAPLVLALLVARGGMRPALSACGVALLPALAALLCSAPLLWTALESAARGDIPRSVDVPMIWSHVVGRGHDLITSLPLEPLVDPLRPKHEHHEASYPFGIYLLACLLFWPSGPKRLRVAGLIALAALLGIVFALRVDPFASALVGGVPLLEAFRVPTRVGLILVPALAALGLGALASAPARGDRRASLVAALVATGLFALGSALLLELFAVASLVLAHLASRPDGGGRFRAVSISPRVALLAVAFLSIDAFAARVLPLLPARAALQEAAAVGTAIRQATPGLSRPLERVHLDVRSPVFFANTAPAMGLASVDAYWNPPSRFLSLYASLTGEPLDPGRGRFELWRDTPAFPAFVALYNLGWSLKATPEGGIVAEPMEGALGPVWLVGGVKLLPDARAIAETILDADSVATLLRRTLLIDSSDPAVRPALEALEALEEGCAEDARVLSLEETPSGGLELEVRTSAPCALVVSHNYLSVFEATLLADEEARALELFPAYGALMGVVLPPGHARVRIEPRLRVPGGPWALPLLGLGLLSVGVLVAPAARRRARETPPA